MVCRVEPASVWDGQPTFVLKYEGQVKQENVNTIPQNHHRPSHQL